MADLNVALVVKELNAIYGRIRELQAAKSDGSAKVVSGSDLDINDILKTPLEAVDDAASGLAYSVFCIGETLMACGGLAAMHQVAEAFEGDGNGAARRATWLDHRWDHVTDEKDTWLA